LSKFPIAFSFAVVQYHSTEELLMQLKSMPLIIALAFSGIVLSGSSARADNFTFSFTDAYGNTLGTVTGEVFGLTNSLTYQSSSATDVLIESYPPVLLGALGPAPIDTFLSPWQIILNSFIEDNGVVVTSYLDVVLSKQFSSTELQLYDYPSLTYTTCPVNEPFCNQYSPNTEQAAVIAGYNDIQFNAAPPGPPPPPGPPASPVPEPSTLALFGTGMFGLAGAVRRRMSK
jgi:hypothetical protein